MDIELEKMSPVPILMLVDYRGHFYSSVRTRGASMDMGSLRRYFQDEGCDLQIENFKDLDFRAENYAGHFVLYQSSEDRHLLYKDYIEDVLLALNYQGATLIPDFYKFRAHHNKAFMELLRDLSQDEAVKSLRSRVYGTIEDLRNDLDRYSLPIVVKPATGALSSGVSLARSKGELMKRVRRLSRSFHLLDYLKNVVNRMIRAGYVPKSAHRRKFVIQEFVSGLQGDYKILVYGKKYFVLYRRIRNNDFRASGSGLFNYEKELPSGLLDYARQIFASFDVPYVSIDVAYIDGAFHLLEFQFLSFGSYTLEHAEFYFAHDGHDWVVKDEVSILEQEVAKSVAVYVRKQLVHSLNDGRLS